MIGDRFDVIAIAGGILSGYGLYLIHDWRLLIIVAGLVIMAAAAAWPRGNKAT